ncbi:dienelactone hydrolase family protein [Actinokineospora sp. 24-640]
MFVDEEVRVPVDTACLDGRLVIPALNSGIVVFAHGSGSGRRSPRNNQVAAALHQSGLGTLLVDLLTADEGRTAESRFDIALLAGRLAGIIDWLGGQPRTAQSPLGLFGASTGAAAALVAAAERPAAVRAVVSRGGRPDLVGVRLGHVQAPTLLIVGGHDQPVIDLNRQSLRKLRATKRLEVVPGATHLFEEPGALDQVAGLAGEWFASHLGAQPLGGFTNWPPPN